MFFGEALRGACRLADSVVGYGFWRAENFLGDVVLLEDYSARDGDQAARGAESFYASLLGEAMSGELRLKYLFKVAVRLWRSCLREFLRSLSRAGIRRGLSLGGSGLCGCFEAALFEPACGYLAGQLADSTD